MLYRVYKIQTLTTTYKVEATSEDEAIELVEAGKAGEADYDNQVNYESHIIEERRKEVNQMLVCAKATCGNRLRRGEPCYQIRVGYLDEEHPDEDVFLPDEDVAYYHQECLPEEI